MINGHGGNKYQLAKRIGCRPGEIIDVSSNINPMGPPPGLIDYLTRHMTDICSLPEVDNRRIVQRMATVFDIADHRILAGAGTTQFIYALFPAFDSKNVLILGPTYADYADACHLHHLRPHYFLTTPKDQFKPNLDRLKREVGKFDTVVICNPNNPTGVMLSRDVLVALTDRNNRRRQIEGGVASKIVTIESPGQISSPPDITSGLQRVSTLSRHHMIYQI